MSTTMEKFFSSCGWLVSGEDGTLHEIVRHDRSPISDGGVITFPLLKPVSSSRRSAADAKQTSVYVSQI